jgi:homoserine kinase
MHKKVTVSVPASSANLGPGYDSLALALDIRDIVKAKLNNSGEIKVEISGFGADSLAKDESHLIAQTILATAKKFNLNISGFTLECENNIPQGRGLGSSAAAVVAGLVLARELAKADLPDDLLLQEATLIEGHPDNVSACLMGGLTISWQTELNEINTRSINVNPAIVPIVGIPDSELSTKQARNLIPTQIPHLDAVFNSARTALLVAALVADPTSLFDATADRLHQEYRRSAYPESMALVDNLREKEVAACISGAGPTVLALTNKENAAMVVGQITSAGFVAKQVKVADTGVNIL